MGRDWSLFGEAVAGWSGRVLSLRFHGASEGVWPCEPKIGTPVAVNWECSQCLRAELSMQDESGATPFDSFIRADSRAVLLDSAHAGLASCDGCPTWLHSIASDPEFMPFLGDSLSEFRALHVTRWAAGDVATWWVRRGVELGFDTPAPVLPAGLGPRLGHSFGHQGCPTARPELMLTRREWVVFERAGRCAADVARDHGAFAYRQRRLVSGDCAARAAVVQVDHGQRTVSS